MSAEEDRTRFRDRRERSNQIPCQERKIERDSMKGEEDKMRFRDRRER
jgi:hypothetical protein